ncbi:hypothetical protein Mapa_001317 [Marchantia paleacea]|nr:hypothetical protein Mapa_001317 [Marchantia paleacea]
MYEPRGTDLAADSCYITELKLTDHFYLDMPEPRPWTRSNSCSHHIHPARTSSPDPTTLGFPTKRPSSHASTSAQKLEQFHSL